MTPYDIMFEITRKKIKEKVNEEKYLDINLLIKY